MSKMFFLVRKKINSITEFVGNYYRPDGFSVYYRPDGTSIYTRP